MARPFAQNAIIKAIQTTVRGIQARMRMILLLAKLPNQLNARTFAHFRQQVDLLRPSEASSTI